MINSDLMDNLKKENIDVAIVYVGNPCLLGIVYTLKIPFIFFDVEGNFDNLIL